MFLERESHRVSSNPRLKTANNADGVSVPWRCYVHHRLLCTHISTRQNWIMLMVNVSSTYLRSYVVRWHHLDIIIVEFTTDLDWIQIILEDLTPGLQGNDHVKIHISWEIFSNLASDWLAAQPPPSKSDNVLGTCDIVHWSAAPHNRIANRTGFWVYVVLVLNVIWYSSHYFLEWILFHHDFHHDSCDYHWDFYGH